MDTDRSFVVGENSIVDPDARVGVKYRTECSQTTIGSDAVVRSFSVIYGDVTIGDHFQCGHHVLIREFTVLGDWVMVGTGTTIDGRVNVGSFVKFQSHVYIPPFTTIGNFVFVGPGATFTDDRYPVRLRDEYSPVGPTLEDNVTVGAGAILLPGVRIGTGSIVAAGAVVTKDVPPWSLVRGVPGRVTELPEKLRQRNQALSWPQDAEHWLLLRGQRDRQTVSN